METQVNGAVEVVETKNFSAALRKILDQATAMLDLKRSELERHRKAIVELEGEIEEIEGLVSFSTGVPTKKKEGRAKYGKLKHRNAMISLMKTHCDMWFDAENLIKLVAGEETPLNITRVKKFLWLQNQAGVLHKDGMRYRWNSAFTGTPHFKE